MYDHRYTIYAQTEGDDLRQLADQYRLVKEAEKASAGRTSPVSLIKRLLDLSRGSLALLSSMGATSASQAINQTERFQMRNKIMKTTRIFFIAAVLLAALLTAGAALARDLGPEEAQSASQEVEIFDNAGYVVRGRLNTLLNEKPESFDTSKLPYGYRCFARWAEHCAEAEASWPDILDR